LATSCPTTSGVPPGASACRARCSTPPPTGQRFRRTQRHRAQKPVDTGRTNAPTGPDPAAATHIPMATESPDGAGHQAGALRWSR
jgi:hypothetical protein